MAINQVKEYFRQWGREGDVLEFPVSSATVELAAKALGTEPGRIAKTISLCGEEGECLLILAAGDRKIDNAKFKHNFHKKAKMLPAADVETMTGHAPGGVCPFANPPGCRVYLDESLKAYDTVYPACGNANSAIALSCAELEEYSRAEGWVDVCKGRED